MVKVGGIYIIPVWVHSGTTHIAQSSGKGNKAAALEADIAGMKESVVETSVDQKHESTNQPNQSTWVTPYRSDLVPLQDHLWNVRTDYVLERKIRSAATTGLNSFWNVSCKLI